MALPTRGEPSEHKQIVDNRGWAIGPLLECSSWWHLTMLTTITHSTLNEMAAAQKAKSWSILTAAFVMGMPPQTFLYTLLSPFSSLRGFCKTVFEKPSATLPPPRSCLISNSHYLAELFKGISSVALAQAPGKSVELR